ncbi:MAG: DNA cytosine methyltransferase [Rhodomicrobium sp.]
MPSFYEFFAGGGMARAGLGPGWNCLFANDFDVKKSRAYNLNWGFGTLKTADIREIRARDLPDQADLVWASFPCQDLSLAGNGAGLRGDRSGTFWPFWGVVNGLLEIGRAPKFIVIENVCGTITSHKGKDFSAICDAFSSAGYHYGGMVIDAKCFVPQSRARLFIVGVRADIVLPRRLTSKMPSELWHSSALQRAYDLLPLKSRTSWMWWTLPKPPKMLTRFADLIESEPKNIAWHTAEQTERLLSMMSNINRAKVEAAKKVGKRAVGGVYKRTRPDEQGKKVQRAEVRFDGIAGCLRTPGGGSSRQTIIVVEGENVRSRLISPRETARLMGLSDDYKLPANYNEAYHLTGDGVAVPVVRHLAQHIFEPILAPNYVRREKAVA